ACVYHTARRQHCVFDSNVISQFTLQRLRPSPASRPMRLSFVFVAIVATLLVTSEALADSNYADRRLLRTHYTTSAESEERGIKDIPTERLNALGKKLGIDVQRATTDTVYFRRISPEVMKKYQKKLNKLIQIYRSTPE
ncbi:hypothetical protein F442_01379, partial [Phytophthora nicotianae P10297]